MKAKSGGERERKYFLDMLESWGKASFVTSRGWQQRDEGIDDCR